MVRGAGCPGKDPATHRSTHAITWYEPWQLSYVECVVILTRKLCTFFFPTTVANHVLFWYGGNVTVRPPSMNIRLWNSKR